VSEATAIRSAICGVDDPTEYAEAIAELDALERERADALGDFTMIRGSIKHEAAKIEGYKDAIRWNLKQIEEAVSRIIQNAGVELD